MKKNKDWLILLIIFLAVLLRLPFLNGSLWLDEAAQALESARPFSEQTQIINDFQPPFLHYVLHFVMLISHQEAWLRLWGALLPGLLTIGGTFLLAKKIFSRRIGLLAAFLLAISSFHVYLSQELRPYVWSAVWAIWSWIFLLEMLNVGQQIWNWKRNSWEDKAWRKLPLGRNLILFLIFSIAGLYTSYLYPFVFITQLFYILIKRNFKYLFLSILIPTLAFLPWLGDFFAQLKTGTALRTTMPGWTEVVSFNQLKSVLMTVAKFIYGVSDLTWSLGYIVSAVLLLSLTVILIISRGPKLWRDKKPALLVLLMGLVLPFILAWVVSFWVPIIQPKRVIFLQPFLVIFWAVLILGWEDAKHKISFKWWLQPKNWAAILLLILLTMINGVSLYNYWTQPILQRENWRDLLTEIRRDFDAEKSVALFSYAAPYSPWSWYEKEWVKQGKYPTYFPTLATGNYYLPTHQEDLVKFGFLSDYEQVLIFDYLRDLTDPERQLDQVVEAQGFTWTRTYDYPNIGFVRIYTRNNEGENI